MYFKKTSIEADSYRQQGKRQADRKKDRQATRQPRSRKTDRKTCRKTDKNGGWTGSRVNRKAKMFKDRPALEADGYWQQGKRQADRKKDRQVTRQTSSVLGIQKQTGESSGMKVERNLSSPFIHPCAGYSICITSITLKRGLDRSLILIIGLSLKLMNAFKSGSVSINALLTHSCLVYVFSQEPFFLHRR